MPLFCVLFKYKFTHFAHTNDTHPKMNSDRTIFFKRTSKRFCLPDRFECEHKAGKCFHLRVDGGWRRKNSWNCVRFIYFSPLKLVLRCGVCWKEGRKMWEKNFLMSSRSWKSDCNFQSFKRRSKGWKLFFVHGTWSLVMKTGFVESYASPIEWWNEIGLN